MTATAVRELIPGWREDELPVHDKLDRDLLLRAYQFGEAAHRGQRRNSGSRTSRTRWRSPRFSPTSSSIR